MFTIIIVTHGTFGEALLSSAELIVGKQKNVYTYKLEHSTSLENLENKIRERLAVETKKTKVVVLTDLLYGTPFNIAVRLMEEFKFQHYTGISMPYFLEIITSRKFRTVSEMNEHVKALNDTFINVNHLLNID